MNTLNKNSAGSIINTQSVGQIGNDLPPQNDYRWLNANISNLNVEIQEQLTVLLTLRLLTNVMKPISGHKTELLNSSNYFGKTKSGTCIVK